MIAVSFPCSPDRYPSESYSWAQISHFVCAALVKTFPDVRFFPSGAEIPLSGKDVLVANVCDAMLRWKRTVIVDNDNIDEGKWLRGRFQKYGMNHPTDYTAIYNGHIEGCAAALVKTNDVAIARWNANEESVAWKKSWFLKSVRSMHVLPHPIDKSFFGQQYNPDATFDRVRMLVYHNGPRKNAAELIALLQKLGFGPGDFAVTNQIAKTPENVERILREYAVLGHVSVSEGFPYLANEFMCQGMLLFGHEEWWDGYGDPRLTWTYNPAQEEENAQKLRFFFDPKNRDEVLSMRKRQWEHHMSRTDNNWSHLTDILIEEVKKLVS